MASTAELISITANEVGDPGFEFLDHNEYVQFLNDTIREIGLKTECLVQMSLINTVANQNTIVLQNAVVAPAVAVQDVFKVLRLEYLVGGANANPQLEQVMSCREIAFTRMQNRLHNMDEERTIITPTTTPVQFFDSNGNVVFTMTTTVPNASPNYMSNWYALKNLNGTVTAYFGFVFAAGDQIRYWYIQNWQDNTAINVTNIIWDPYRIAVQEGMRWRAMRRLQFRPKAGKVQNWEFSKAAEASRELYYKQYIPEIKKYIVALKTTQDAMRIDPFKYL